MNIFISLFDKCFPFIQSKTKLTMDYCTSAIKNTSTTKLQVLKSLISPTLFNISLYYKYKMCIPKPVHHSCPMVSEVIIILLIYQIVLFFNFYYYHSWIFAPQSIVLSGKANSIKPNLDKGPSYVLLTL